MYISIPITVKLNPITYTVFSTPVIPLAYPTYHP